MPKKPTTKQFVLLSDLHLHPWALFAKGDGAANTRLRRSLVVLRASLDRARELNVPWTFPGDIVHTAGYALNVVMSALTDTLADYGDVEKFAVWGNHDARGIGGTITLAQTVFGALSRSVENLYVLEGGQSPLLAANGLTFAGAGYQPSAELLQFAQESDVGLYHQTVRGSRNAFGVVMPEGISRDVLMARHRVSVVGHVHQPQYLGESVLIPGSPEHHNFGDAGTHGWWVVTLPAKSKQAAPEYELIPGGSPEFLTVDKPEQVVGGTGNFYRVRSASRVEDLPDGAIAIAPSPSEITQRARFKGAVGPEMLAHWLAVAPPDADLPRERFLEAGVKILGTGGAAGAVRPLALTVINLENFCSYEKSQLVVKPGVSLILGRGRDFPSNGAGKSTLFEALFWLLFGTTTKGLSGDDVIRWGQDTCAVSARFANPGDLTDWLEVRRTRGKGAGLTVITSEGPLEAATTPDLTKRLAEYLGVTADLYQALAYFSQERLLLFASATDGERKDMLADLLGLEVFQLAAKAAASTCTALEETGIRARTLREASEAQIVQLDTRIAALHEQVIEWDRGQSRKLDAARDLAAAFDAVAFTAECAATHRRATEAQLQPRITAAQQEVSQLTALIAQSEQFVLKDELSAVETAAEVCTRVRFKLSAAKATEVATTRAYEDAQSTLSRAVDAVRGGECPACRQGISDDHRAVVVAPLEERVATLRSEVEACSAARLKWQRDEVLMVGRENDAKARLRGASTFAEWQTTRDTRKGEIAQWQTLLAEAAANAERHAARECAARQKTFTDALAALSAMVNPHAQALAEATSQRQQRETAVEEAAALRLKIQEEIAIHDYWRRAFSRQGLQSLLMDEVAAQFNDARGDIFPALTQGVYDVQFQTISHTRSGDAREKTEFQVFDRGERTPYAALSGGQRRRIDVGVMLTLVKAVSQWMGTPGVLGVLVLDEVFGFLDASGAEGLLEALREVQVQVPSIFVVSHDQQMQALFPETILVEQGADGVSRLAE